jgi:ribosomal protein L37AE/L43A
MPECPGCGGYNVRQVWPDVYHCRDCDEEWEEWGYFPSEDEESTNKELDQAARNQRINK